MKTFKKICFHGSAIFIGTIWIIIILLFLRNAIDSRIERHIEDLQTVVVCPCIELHESEVSE